MVVVGCRTLDRPQGSCLQGPGSRSRGVWEEMLRRRRRTTGQTLPKCKIARHTSDPTQPCGSCGYGGVECGELATCLGPDPRSQSRSRAALNINNQLAHGTMWREAAPRRGGIREEIPACIQCRQVSRGSDATGITPVLQSILSCAPSAHNQLLGPRNVGQQRGEAGRAESSHISRDLGAWSLPGLAVDWPWTVPTRSETIAIVADAGAWQPDEFHASPAR